MSDERDRLKAIFSASPDCPSLDELTQDPASAKKAEDCPRCTGEAALYEQFMKGVPEAELDQAILQRLNSRLPTAASPPRTGFWSMGWWRPGFYAPAIVAVAGLLVIAGIALRRDSNTLPAGPAHEIVERGQTIELLAPKGEIALPPTVLTWKILPGASAYRVKLMEVDRNVVWESQAKLPSVTLPLAIRNKALPGKRLIWSVEGFDRNGQLLGMGTQDFRRTVVPK
jgi:hypothetical protein